MLKRIFLLAALLLAAPAFGQDFTPVVTGADVKTVIVVAKLPATIAAPPGAAFYAWSVPASVTFTDNFDKIEVTAAPAGDLTIVVKTVVVDFDAKKVVVKQGRVTVSVGGVKPPGPPDPPGPTTKPAWVVVIEETAERTEATGRLLGDLPGWQALGVSWRFYDKDAPEVRAKKYDLVVSKAGVGLPAMILLDKAGNVIGAMKLPATMADVRKAVNP
jgi:hypothetical protein